jgi:hypothetical protein
MNPAGGRICARWVTRQTAAFVPAVFDELLGFVPPDLAKSKAKRYLIDPAGKASHDEREGTEEWRHAENSRAAWRTSAVFSMPSNFYTCGITGTFRRCQVRAERSGR